MGRTTGLLLSFLAASAAHAHAQLGAPIAAERIRAAVLARYPELTSVRPLVAPVSRSADPVLLPGAIEQWGSAGLRVRMHCQTTGDCVPFYVAVSHEQQPGGSSAPLSPASVVANQPATADGARVGSFVTLRIDSGHLHLTMPVTVLSSAPIGGQVRVQFRPAPLSAESRPPQPRVLLATVIDARTVRGDLQ
jgi:hypothetical protein